jgi:hypothetical protein
MGSNIHYPNWRYRSSLHRRLLNHEPFHRQQAFLEDHLDEFFPSPSQEIRELLDNIDDTPTDTQIARELEPVLLLVATQTFLEDHLNEFFPSPSQEIRELLGDIDDIPTDTQIARELEPVIPQAATHAFLEDILTDTSASLHHLATVLTKVNEPTMSIARCIPIGIKELDCMLQNRGYTIACGNDTFYGGFSRGKISEVWGPPGVRKTSLGMQLAANALTTSGRVIWVDASHPLLGLRFSQLRISWNN